VGSIIELNKKINFMKTLLTLLIALALMASGKITSEERTVSGTVTSADDGSPIPGVNVVLKGTLTGTVTDAQGFYSLNVPLQNGTLVFAFIGYQTKEIAIGKHPIINVALQQDVQELREVVVTGYALQGKVAGVRIRGTSSKKYEMNAAPVQDGYWSPPVHNTEEYDAINENIFHDAQKNPLSTFSIDVDAASYSNLRRYINGGQRPPKDAVRIEEMINYFNYEYPQPKGEDPFSINTEISVAPWNPQHKLVQIGLQGRVIAKDKLPASNLVFLIDVSGSMNEPNKLPLLKSSFKMLVNQLRDQDRVAIVVYAGAAGLVLPSTPGSEKKIIMEALENLQAGGSTAGGAGIRLAYDIAKKHLNEEGNNRVILATDGDFNVGESSNAAMERLIEEKRKEGIFLTVLGYGMGNYKDSKMETLSNKGNGNYFYIDSILEAQKALVNEFGGTLFTIAKDVKLQVEFNPARVKSYRLIGYENRMLRAEDFNDDKKDAGELGAGHIVTALYEIIPTGIQSEYSNIDELKYQKNSITASAEGKQEIMTIKFRYKKPEGTTSKLIVHPLVDKNISLKNTSENFRWATAVAAFGMILRESEYVKDFTCHDVIQLANSAKGVDENGYRIEFINLVKSFETTHTK
jgi:Ca-activated chloride channel homolog